MELYLDTSGVAAVKALSRTFPPMGVTTNPSITAAGKKSLGVVLPQLHEVMGGQGRLFAQVMATTVKRMTSDVRKLRSTIADIMAEIPVTAKRLTTVKMLKAEGTPTLGTAIYDTVQGLLLVLVGAERVASYINRIDAQDGSGAQTVTDLHQLLEMHTPQAKMLAASFEAPRQALDCLLARDESITLPPDMAQ